MKRYTLVVVPALILLIGAGCQKNEVPKDTGNNTSAQTEQQPGSGNGRSQNNSGGTTTTWQNYGNGQWVASGAVPPCPTPLFAQSPADVSQVTSILYPGQTRGGNYKPHGGFRFDTIHNNVVNVVAPLDAQVVRGSRYLVGGEVQYTFDFIAPCGYMYRLGHLRELTPTFQTIADSFPAAAEGDSRTTNVDPAVNVKRGDLVATKVGTTKDGNTFFDFGVYNLQEKNSASHNATWAANEAHDPELAQHAVCWFTLLPTADATRVQSLPAGDPTSGKTSDYCSS